MRRKDREITDRAEIEDIIREATVCRIAFADGGKPYVVPLSFGFEDCAVYFHSAPEGQKIDMLTKNPSCCFEVDICDRLVKGDRPCSWGMRYRSVIGHGRAAIIEDPGEKRRGLNCIMQHYGGGTFNFSEKDLDGVMVIRIALDSVSGKKHD